MSAVLEASAVHFSYDSRVILADCSFSLQNGEFAALAGPNGAGKSTLFSLLCGCRQPHSGEVSVIGKAIERWVPRDLARKLAVLPQNPIVPDHMTVLETALLGRTPFLTGFFRFETRQDREAAMEALRLTGVHNLEKRKLCTLSGGERQLVYLARALAQQPEILLLDEPSASLDLHHQQAIFRILSQLNRERGLTILAVIHDLNLAAVYCERMMLLNEGKICADNSPAELLASGIIPEVYRAEVVSGSRPDGAPIIGLLP